MKAGLCHTGKIGSQSDDGVDRMTPAAHYRKLSGPREISSGDGFVFDGYPRRMSA